MAPAVIMEDVLEVNRNVLPPLMFVFGTIVLILGSIWPAMVWNDFEAEQDSVTWPMTNATVVQMQISMRSYSCGDSQSPQICEEYTLNYNIEYFVDGQLYSVEETKDVSYFQSRVWKVDHKEGSEIDVAYDPTNPEIHDTDPGNYAPFIPPLFIFGFSVIIALAFYAGGLKLFVKSKQGQGMSASDRKKLPQSSDEVTFDSSNAAWGEKKYLHPTVQALAEKMKLFSCTRNQIDTFFSACEERKEDPSNNEVFDLNWLNGINDKIEQHNSVAKYDIIGKIKIGRIILSIISGLFIIPCLLVILPLWMKYNALPWYGWGLLWCTVSPIMLITASSRIMKELEKFADQGLAEVLISMANGTYDSDN